GAAETQCQKSAACPLLRSLPCMRRVPPKPDHARSSNQAGSGNSENVPSSIDWGGTIADENERAKWKCRSWPGGFDHRYHVGEGRHVRLEHREQADHSGQDNAVPDHGLENVRFLAELVGGRGRDANALGVD